MASWFRGTGPNWSCSTPGHVGLHGRCIRLIDDCDFAQVALPLPVLVLEKVALPLFTTQDLAGGSDLEPLGNGLSRFG